MHNLNSSLSTLGQVDPGTSLITIEKWRDYANECAFRGDYQLALQIAGLIEQTGKHLNNIAIVAIGNWAFGNVYTILHQGQKAVHCYQTAARHYK
jgi:hypothetical protein